MPRGAQSSQGGLPDRVHVQGTGTGVRVEVGVVGGVVGVVVGVAVDALRRSSPSRRCSRQCPCAWYRNRSESWSRCGSSGNSSRSCSSLFISICPFPPLSLQVPDHGTLPISGYDYPEQFSEFSFRTLMTKAEVISALIKIKVESSKVLKMSLFNLNYTKSCRLDEFEQVR
jgi:hypothetical protein